MLPRLEGAEDPVGVAAANADAFHLDVPDVPGAVVLAAQLNGLLGLAGVAIAEQQQLDTAGTGGGQGEVHPPGGGLRPQGPGLSEMDRSQRILRAAATN